MSNEKTITITAPEALFNRINSTAEKAGTDAASVILDILKKKFPASLDCDPKLKMKATDAAQTKLFRDHLYLVARNWTADNGFTFDLVCGNDDVCVFTMVNVRTDELPEDDATLYDRAAMEAAAMQFMADEVDDGEDIHVRFDVFNFLIHGDSSRALMRHHVGVFNPIE